jgi:uncharacterized protein (DUF1778 family)
MAKDDRFELRCTAAEKALMQQAAGLDGRSLSDWVRRVAVREAEKALARAAGRAGKKGTR